MTGNVKENGVRAIEKLGPYELTGDASVMKLLDELLAAFVAQKRMKLAGQRIPAVLPPGGLTAIVVGPNQTITRHNVKSRARVSRDGAT